MKVEKETLSYSSAVCASSGGDGMKKVSHLFECMIGTVAYLILICCHYCVLQSNSNGSSNNGSSNSQKKPAVSSSKKAVPVVKGAGSIMSFFAKKK